MSTPFEYPDEAGYPDGAGFLDEGSRALIAELNGIDHHNDVPLSEYDLLMFHDDVHSRYTAWLDGEEAATMPYRIVAGRFILLTTTVREDLRGHGVATEFISWVLDDIRTSRRQVTNYCPIVRTFIDQYPQYEDVLDTRRPGVTSDSVEKAAATTEPRRLVYVDDEISAFEQGLDRGGDAI
jgi:predicted GNAT family acetyltransferase